MKTSNLVPLNKDNQFITNILNNKMQVLRLYEYI